MRENSNKKSVDFFKSVTWRFRKCKWHFFKFTGLKLQIYVRLSYGFSTLQLFNFSTIQQKTADFWKQIEFVFCLMFMNLRVKSEIALPTATSFCLQNGNVYSIDLKTANFWDFFMIQKPRKSKFHEDFNGIFRFWIFQRLLR